MKSLFLLAVFSVIAYVPCYSQNDYRFDYEWNQEAGGWLKYHVIPATWDEARLHCHAEGAVLASPITNQLKLAIVEFVNKQSGSDADGPMITLFTGVHATFSKGDYSSIEGVPLLRLAISWAAGEPDNYDNSESCLAMMMNHMGTMADTRCDRVLPYVCYKKDTNFTITECGTTDPGYLKDSRTGSCYKFHKTGLVWSEAYMTCFAEGGYLAVINNEVEAEVIKDIISRHPAIDNLAFNRDLTSVGFHDWGHFGTNFMTIHGQALQVNHNVWGKGEPNNLTLEKFGGRGESCGSVVRNVNWNDVICNILTAFLCEKNPNSLLNDFQGQSIFWVQFY